MDDIRDKLYEPLRKAIIREHKYRNDWAPHAEIRHIDANSVQFALMWRDEEQDTMTCGYKWLDAGCPGHFYLDSEQESNADEYREYLKLKAKYEGVEHVKMCPHCQAADADGKFRQDTCAVDGLECDGTHFPECGKDMKPLRARDILGKGFHDNGCPHWEAGTADDGNYWPSKCKIDGEECNGNRWPACGK
jgi:hypothetical protein